jgi:hypothetical protein
MHWLRLRITVSGWFEFDGRITTLIPSDEVDNLKLLDSFTAKLAPHANSNLKSLFFIKIAVLAVNLVPFIWSWVASRSPQATEHTSRVENALAIHIARVGGLGRSLAS